MTRYAVLDKSNNVVNIVVWDGDTASWSPEGGFTAKEIQDDVYVTIGSTLKRGNFEAPREEEVIQKSAETLLLEANRKLSSLQAEASMITAEVKNRVDILQEAVNNIGVKGSESFAATDAEKVELDDKNTLLSDLKKYNILLGRVSSQEGWPEAADWPVKPEESK